MEDKRSLSSVPPSSFAGGSAMSDNASARVESLLRDRLSGRIRNLRVVIEDGGVVLQGSTVSYHCKQLAQHVIMQGLGLSIRANQLEVRRGVTPPNAQ
jgi:hypothetical protein